MRVDIYSFFSGLGFLDLGFEKEGFHIEMVNEFNPQFLAAYKYGRNNKDNTPQYGYHNRDVRDFLNDDLWNKTTDFKRDRLVGFIGGPPCPDFSIAGKNSGVSGKNGQLTDVYMQLLLKRKPDFFVFENVKGLYTTRKHREYYNYMKKTLDDAGYILSDKVLNALEYGVPQFRDRLILVGFLKTSFKQCDFKLGSRKLYDLQYIQSMNWPKKLPFCEESIIAKPRNIIKELTPEYWFQKNKVYDHENALDVFNIVKRERFFDIWEGDVSRKSFKRLHRWRYSPTAAYGNNEVHLHPYKPRRLSVAETLAIQSLPKDFTLPHNIPLTQKFKMIGNGVPFLLAKGIANEIKEFILSHQ